MAGAIPEARGILRATGAPPERFPESAFAAALVSGLSLQTEVDGCRLFNVGMKHSSP
jgi:hypothetical protein